MPPFPPRNPRPMTPTEVRLLAILEADIGWLDRETLAQRFNQRAGFSPYQAQALKRLIRRGRVEVEERPGPKRMARHYYRYVPPT